MNHGPTRAPRWTPTRAAPFWLCWAGVGMAALFLLRSTNWAREGFSSPTGEYLFILIRAAMLWILVTSITLVRAAPSGPATQGRSPA